MKVKELQDEITKLDNGDNLEVQLIVRLSMGGEEFAGQILVERVKTKDFIRLTRIIEQRMTSFPKKGKETK